MKYPFISEHRGIFRVDRMCKVLDISRSGYYAWLKRKDSPGKREKVSGQRKTENWLLKLR